MSRPRVTDSTAARAFDDVQLQLGRALEATPSLLGRLRVRPRSVTGNFAVTVDDAVVVYTGPGTQSAQLPRSGGRAEAQIIVIVNAGKGNLTARAVSGEFIDGATAQTLANARAHLLVSDARGGWYHWGS